MKTIIIIVCDSKFDSCFPAHINKGVELIQVENLNKNNLIQLPEPQPFKITPLPELKECYLVKPKHEYQNQKHQYKLASKLHSRKK